MRPALPNRQIGPDEKATRGAGGATTLGPAGPGPSTTGDAHAHESDMTSLRCAGGLGRACLLGPEGAVRRGCGWLTLRVSQGVIGRGGNNFGHLTDREKIIRGSTEKEK